MNREVRWTGVKIQGVLRLREGLVKIENDEVLYLCEVNIDSVYSGY